MTDSRLQAAMAHDARIEELFALVSISAPSQIFVQFGRCALLTSVCGAAKARGWALPISENSNKYAVGYSEVAIS